MNMASVYGAVDSSRSSVADNPNSTATSMPLPVLKSCQHEILNIIMHPSKSIKRSCYSDWFEHYLESRVRNFSRTPLGQSLIPFISVEGSPINGQSGVVISIYQILVIIAREVVSGGTSINTIAQRVMDLKPETRSASPYRVYKFIFKCIAMITLLFDASDDMASSKLQLQLPNASSRKKSRFKQSSIWIRMECPISDTSGGTMDMDIDHLMSHFGNLAPSRSYPSLGHNQDLYKNTIIASNLNYHTLSKIGKLTIEWVESLSLHLELHERTSVVRVFQFPSFCALVCSQMDGQETLLSKLISNGTSELQPDELLNNGQQYTYSRDFLIEVLCSYRLLFGQHHKSYTAFPGICPGGFQDPLLQQLCGTSCKRHDFYDELEVGDSKAMYSAASDFPLIGQRILTLQDYMNSQNPSDLRTLWYDKRDILRWYTFWAVVSVGGLGILLSIVSVALTAAQVSQGAQSLKSQSTNS
ncbi:uncharacterized protein LY89DRAFT_98574 [Mollisia scopiformis]|uniref:Uncharacterized protein n=1 Tax=Mollisia scopiformis TaxID=149040 RepID=A0A194X7W3_MOLSC|nr:uncharacterized protein LY89DRAFT_98574 [Mollisia scopiformis]KUJ15902.1 hypothetical protein LY89DRAFT_98574 [Mollisia scopiformis]